MLPGCSTINIYPCHYLLQNFVFSGCWNFTSVCFPWLGKKSINWGSGYPWLGLFERLLKETWKNSLSRIICGFVQKNPEMFLSFLLRIRLKDRQPSSAKRMSTALCTVALDLGLFSSFYLRALNARFVIGRLFFNLLSNCWEWI